MPDPIPASVPLDADIPRPCAASVFTCCHPAGPESGRLQPYYSVSKLDTSIYADADLSNKTINALTNFDANPNVFVAIAHDPTIAAYVSAINEAGSEQSHMNDWKARGLKEKCHWDFLNELPRNGEPGRSKLVDGYECAGQKYFYDLQNMTLYIN